MPTHRRIRPFNTKDTYPEQHLSNDLCQAVVANGVVYLRGQVAQDLETREDVGVGDPAGTQRSQTDGSQCIQILRECGIPTEEADTNSFVARRDAVGYFLTRLTGGHPAMKISPKCAVTRKGLQGEYKYKELRIGGLNGRKRFNETPDKNFYSHVADALQYACLKIKNSVLRAESATPMQAPRRPVVKRNMNAYT